MVTVRGTVKVAYNPKYGRGQFFFQFETEDGKVHKSMAWVSFRETIVKGAVVDLEGAERGEWFNLKAATLVSKPELAAETRVLELGHVGQPKPTRFGTGSYAKVGDRWCVVPCRASRRFFDGDDGNGDVPFEFPGRGRGTLTASVVDDGDSMAAVEILAWEPRRTHVVADVLPSQALHGFDRDGERFVIPAHVLPVMFQDRIEKLGLLVHVDATFRARSLSLDRWVWEFDAGTAALDAEAQVRLDEATWNDKVARATAAVRDEMFRLIEAGIVVDDTLVADLFLKQGVQATAGQVEEMYSTGYDARYLKALVGMGERSWRLVDGFVVKVGLWLAWERCVAGAATYLVPARAPVATTGKLTLDEWVGVLAKVLPECNKMQLRYGELGQMLTGTPEGARFAFHVEDDDGGFGGWLAAVEGAVATEPAERKAVAFDLGKVLALASGD